MVFVVKTYQITSIPVERKSFNWMVVENKCIKWEMDSVYLGDYLKRQLGWEGKKKTKKVKEPTTNQVIPNTHGIINQNGKLYVIYIHPHKEWTDTETPKIHWMNTEHNNWKQYLNTHIGMTMTLIKTTTKYGRKIERITNDTKK